MMYRALTGRLLPCVALAGCLATPVAGDAPAMCDTSADCNTAAGEICDDGICWGDPPDAQFAAVLAPPEGNSALVPTEIVSLDIASDGTIGSLAFADAVSWSGRVLLACSPEDAPGLCQTGDSVAAQVTVTRASAFEGGPRYTRTTIASAGAGTNEPAFALRLPRTAEGGEPFEFTIVPDTGGIVGAYEGLTPAELAPPRRFRTVAPADSANIEWVLGDPDSHRLVEGTVLDAAGRGLAGMQVFALGQWIDGGPVERISTVTTTGADGAFTLRVPLDVQSGTVELVAKPAQGTLAPTLRAPDTSLPEPVEGAQDESVSLGALRMPDYPNPVSVVVPVVGFGADGTPAPVAGAEVELTLALDASGGTDATYVARGLTGTDGSVRLDLIPGSPVATREYVARVTPPAGSQYGAISDTFVTVGTVGPDTWLSALQLTRRIGVRGTVYSASGELLVGATVLATPALRFKWSLDVELQQKLDSLPRPTAATDGNGEFQLFLDQQLYGAEARYDLEVIPPAGSNAPRWTVSGVDLSRPDNIGVVDLGALWLPSASHARGVVISPSGESVPGAEVRVYQVASDGTACIGANLPADTECQVPARLRGVWVSDAEGRLHVVLPRQ